MPPTAQSSFVLDQCNHIPRWKAGGSIIEQKYCQRSNEFTSLDILMEKYSVTDLEQFFLLQTLIDLCAQYYKTIRNYEIENGVQTMKFFNNIVSPLLSRTEIFYTKVHNNIHEIYLFLKIFLSCYYNCDTVHRKSLA